METKRSTFATSFYIKRSAVRNRDGKAPIMVKISVDGDDKAVGTKLFVTPDLWENGKAKGKSAEANEINGQLKEVSARLTNHYHRILREEDFVTAEKLRNAFLGVGVMENCILKDFGNMNREFEAMVEKGQRAKSTYNKYLAVYNHFKTFLWEKKKRTDMAYKELTKEIITDFDKYLRVEKGLSANTLWIYTMPLLSLTDKAWRRGIVRTDPFGEYSLEMQETDRGYLTEEELRTLANAVFVKKQTSLVPTGKGLAVYQIVKDKRIADVEMTGQWETALAKIESGEMNPDTFRKGIEVYAAQITEELLQVQVSVADGGHIPCPKCRSGRILLYPKVAKCSNVDCGLTVFRGKGEKQLTDSQIADLVTKGKTSLIKGFRSREGKPFDAYLTFDKDFRTVYGFPPRTDKSKGKERRR